MADKEELYLRQANPHRAWYVIHTYSGYENKVKANLERLMHSASMSEMIFNVVVPVENEIEMKDGKEKVVPRKVFPGYVLVDMIVDEHSWYVVRNTTGVTGFVGSEKHPIPLTAEEAAASARGSLSVGGGRCPPPCSWPWPMRSTAPSPTPWRRSAPPGPSSRPTSASKTRGTESLSSTASTAVRPA